MKTLLLHFLLCLIYMFTYNLFFENRHTQYGSAYSVYLLANVQRWPKYTLILLSFYTFSSSATKEVTNGSEIKLKAFKCTPPIP